MHVFLRTAVVIKISIPKKRRFCKTKPCFSSLPKVEFCRKKVFAAAERKELQKYVDSVKMLLGDSINEYIKEEKSLNP